LQLLKTDGQHSVAYAEVILHGTCPQCRCKVNVRTPAHRRSPRDHPPPSRFR
jgi:hypothetical protein